MENSQNVHLKLIENEIQSLLMQNKEKLMFDTQKLFWISHTRNDISQILKSLNAIKNNPKIKKFEPKNEPKISVLYSKNLIEIKPLSNVLYGNSFFVTLCGNNICTRKALSSILHEKLENHEINDYITIYGPVSIITFGNTANTSINKIKSFGPKFPNIFFIEISDQDVNQIYENWGQLISIISHFFIICSEEKINEHILKPNFKGKLIYLSQNFNERKNFGNKQNERYADYNFTFNSLDNYKNELQNCIFDELYRIKFQFIPYETTLATFKDIQNNMLIDNLISKFETNKMYHYAYLIHNKSIQYLHKQIHELTHRKWQVVEIWEYYYIYNYEDYFNKLCEETRQYLFSNIYLEFWNNEQITKISQVIIKEIRNDFDSSIDQLKKIGAVGILINALNSKNSRPFKYNDYEIFKYVKTFSPSLNSYSLPKTEKTMQKLLSELILIYESLTHDELYQFKIDEYTKLFSYQLYSFLNKNPIASDEEYGLYYSNLHVENYLIPNSIFSKCCNLVLSIRDVPIKYRPKKYIIDIDASCYENLLFKNQSNFFELNLSPEITCHELYKLVKKTLKLNEIPFYLTRSIKNKFHQQIEIEIFNDQISISELNSFNFKFYIGGRYQSTYSYIESLIAQKTIEIADDFVIKTRSKNTSFQVNYKKDHKGWFNVPFDINQKWGNKEDVLLFLKLSADEISMIQEGNTIDHQYYKDNKWITEEDPVFVTYPECDTAIILLRHCSKHMIVLNPTDLHNIIPKSLINKKYSRDWEGYDDNKEYTRGGKPYYLPVGFQSEGIKVKNFIKYTCVGFHGTKAKNVKSIIENGFWLPSENGGPLKGHYKLNDIHFDIPNFADAIFVSPSIKYASLYAGKPIIAQNEKIICVETGHVIHGLIRIVILQVRVTPKSYGIFKNTLNIDAKDQHYSKNEIEWRIPKKSDVFPYRVLFKHISFENYVEYYYIV